MEGQLIMRRTNQNRNGTHKASRLERRWLAHSFLFYFNPFPPISLPLRDSNPFHSEPESRISHPGVLHSVSAALPRPRPGPGGRHVRPSSPAAAASPAAAQAELVVARFVQGGGVGAAQGARESAEQERHGGGSGRAQGLLRARLRLRLPRFGPQAVGCLPCLRIVPCCQQALQRRRFEVLLRLAFPHLHPRRGSEEDEIEIETMGTGGCLFSKAFMTLHSFEVNQNKTNSTIHHLK